MYKQNSNRTFFASNISLLVAGTLIILITSLFMNAGARMRISDDDLSANQIAMNSLISAASAGLCMVLLNQWTHVFQNEEKI